MEGNSPKTTFMATMACPGGNSVLLLWEAVTHGTGHPRMALGTAQEGDSDV